MAEKEAAGQVLILHGFGGLPIQCWPLAQGIERAGYRAVTLGYDSWGKSLDAIVETLRARFDQLVGDDGAPLHIVGHSMGGLVARAFLHRRRPANLGRVVMLGTPNHGSEIADFIAGHAALRPILGRAGPALVTQRDDEVTAQLGAVDFPLGIIAGSRPILPGPIARMIPEPGDGKVSVASTRLEGAADHLVMPVSHAMMLYDPRVRRQVLHFLAHGRFDAATDEPATG